MRFLYFYLMRFEPDSIRRTAPDHARYWESLGLEGYEGGPFADRSGGLILFHTDSEERAAQLVAEDPFRHADLIESYWLKEWSVHPDR